MQTRLIGTLLVVALAAAPAVAFAQAKYPVKAVRIVLPFAAGSAVDTLARIYAQQMTESWGQQVLVDNRTGANGIIGMELIAKAPPDGYTIGMGNIATLAINSSLYAKIPYDSTRDYAPISFIAAITNCLIVHPSLPVRSVKDLVALARARPGQVTYASAGSGTSTHLAAVLFEHLGRVKMVHVPFKGGGPAIVALISGEMPVTFGTAASVSPQTRSGRLRGLAVTSARRSAVLPELPTIAESGLPGYEMLNWLGLFAPAGTPRAIVERLSGESLRIVRAPEVVARFHAQGAEPSPLGADEFAAFVKSEIDKWAKVVAATGMSAE